jgi:hypothetical protein
MHATPLATVASCTGSILSTVSQVIARGCGKALSYMRCFKGAEKLACTVKSKRVAGLQVRLSFTDLRASSEG